MRGLNGAGCFLTFIYYCAALSFCDEMAIYKEDCIAFKADVYLHESKKRKKKQQFIR